ncbi:MBL fold metallo-hydrolase [Salmonella enterica subsp. enterica serovar Wilhelmsburg]|uniref:MBL fold metallo-hydrolase n=1 Tax=Salmonella enterica subsp. enterica serovar Wilhelmsburg TaxID=1960126 RepID=A0A659P087_SALET|nr:MBL fold metallo-hydrolase [Salmonella enterica]TGC64040.1 MBL fold metallo-hydrolase [Salmonella enterica subsp. enterica serovar Wilhelmsburg]TGC73277.1 MBL fold metallo-hydrolase [Salmonella enterica subsp. enterica serovar Wilhelmsburg]TGC80010.1 MBL fold metallo-hydrolase [Salmonella enterica subsp. enterica serovar Wilhelmsburg]TGC88269.1 MBL fold metallo-hydrolase [Salmonella enterica subsp. enterica serovar Wilhelmsburg]TGC90335.1 MBL fold metallo-hydrolase [Salmonella enterica subs
MALAITVLLENRRATGADNALRVKPGLSLLIQDETTSILFDTGPDGSFMHNAALMGIDLSELTAVVLSHGHYDHCGGVSWLPDNTRIICHPLVAQERHAAIKLPGYTWKIKKLSCEINYLRHQMEYTSNPVLISERFMWSGEISVSEERAYGVVGNKKGGVDYILDEGVLIYKSDNGLIIITGCGHRGLINSVNHCQKITGINKIHALIGGFHLRCASPYRLWQIRQFLGQQKPAKIFGCHCTGAWGRLWLPGMVSPAKGDILYV